jgi:hypothetical protein
MAEATKVNTFGGTLVAKMEKYGNHYLVEKGVMDHVMAIDVIRRNILQI